MPLDIHIHPWTRDFVKKNEPILKACSFFGISPDSIPDSIEGLMEEMERAGVGMGVILGQDTSYTNNKYFANYTISNDYLAKLVEKSNGRLLFFAGIDPRSGIEGVRELKKAIKELGCSGLKIHCSANSVYPNEERVEMLCEVCQEHDIPVLFHTGTTGLAYCDIKYSKPEYIDEVANDFPELKIVMAHFGWPWHEVAIAVALRHENVYLDISGWKPRYLPESLIRYMNGPLSKKVLFGSDYPMIKQQEWVVDFEERLKPKLKYPGLLLDENAKNLLKI